MAAPDLSYFRPAQCSFWRWEENVTVIAGASGHTICYREELLSILRELAPSGLPTLANILICLAACQEGTFYQSKLEKSLDDLDHMFTMAHTVPPLSLVEYRRQAKALMAIIGALPIELRKGTRRIHLINELFEGSRKIVEEYAIPLIDEFSSGRGDAYVMQPYPARSDAPVTWVTDRDIADLQKVVSAYHNTAILELKLKTGILEVAEKIEFEIPEVKEGSDKDLMEELLEDERTSGLAQLTQRMIAALNIPMHTASASDHSYGGISDISNRGNFDRLLLSELANDDMSLMARLVNNEALYLRREAPPVNFDRCRNILVDTTLRMWGLPRFFSISAALACAQNHHHTASVDAYALGEDGYEEIDLHSKEGVVNSLERLDPGLDSWQALLSFLDEQDYKSNTENILIVGDEFFQAPSYMTYHDEIQKKLDFLITVNRKGEVQFFEFLNGRRKLMSTSRFDLDEIIKKVVPHKKLESSGQLPAFYQCYPYPLYFPTMNMKGGSRNMFKAVEGLVGVNEQRRLLYWRNSQKGARELFTKVAGDRYCFGAKDNRLAYLVAYSDYQFVFKIYKLDLLEGEAMEMDIKDTFGKIKDMAYHQGAFYINCEEKGRVSLDADSGLLSDRHISDSDFALYAQAYRTKYLKPAGAKRFINNGYGVFQRLSHAAINSNKRLVISGYSLVLSKQNHLELQMENQRTIFGTGPVEVYKDDLMPHVRFFRAKWHDGSQIMIDTNGLIHLRSSDTSLPEITFGSILDKPNACWSSDHYVCGSLYFYDMGKAQQMDPTEFYARYIQTFIDHIAK